MIQGNELNAGEDWTKFVTLNPPQEVKFKLIDQERLRATDTNNDVKAQANIEIINKSKSAILFKVFYFQSLFFKYAFYSKILFLIESNF